MDGAMGQEEDVVEAVLTCEGDFHDPELQNQIEKFRHRLKDLLDTETDHVQVKKVEPWNSVKVTLTIPKEAAIRLRQLAQNGNEALRQIGVLSVQVQGDSQIALTFLGSNNERQEVVLNTSPAPQDIPSTSAAARQQRPEDASAASLGDNSASTSSSHGPSSDEVMRKNIVDYLKQGPHLRQNSSLIGSLMNAVGAVSTSKTSIAAAGSSMGLNHMTNVRFGGPHASQPNRVSSATTAMAANQPRPESLMTNNFPIKTSGAFQPLVPRHPSSVASYSSQLQSHQFQRHGTRFDSPLLTQSDMSCNPVNSSSCEPGLSSLVSSSNSFSTLGSVMSPANPINSSTPGVIPSSSSLQSSYFMNLPPPPPYPHGASSTASSLVDRQSKPSTSGPVLVNLLQTDSSAAAAKVDGSNLNRSFMVGETGGTDSPPKKKRKKKQKSANAKAGNEFVPNQGEFQSSVAQTALGLDSRMSPKFSATKQDHSRMLGFLHDNVTPSSQVNPLNESLRDGLVSNRYQSDSMKSAIGITGNRQTPPMQVDVFSSDTAAGKIINPYTGQLEPREIIDTGQARLHEHKLSQNTSYSATQMLAKRAQELDGIAQQSVPTSTAMLDNVHVNQPVYASNPNIVSQPTFTTTTAVTAASTVLSGHLSQIPSVTIHSSNVSTAVSRVAQNLSQSSIYAGSPYMWQNSGGTKPSLLTLPSSLASSDTSFPKTVTTKLSNGPIVNDSGSSRHAKIVSSETHASLQESNATSSVILSSINSPSLPHHVTSISDKQKASLHSKGPPASTTLSPSLSSSMAALQDVSSAYSRLQPSHRRVNEPAQAPHPRHMVGAAAGEVGKSKPSIPAASPKQLLNPFSEKHSIDLQNCSESPPEVKVLSEGDENSNHSGLVADPISDQSAGTAALLEHSRVKLENHDSGVGSSSERSDDTPSEPGDGEFRSGQAAAESEENGSKVNFSSQKDTIKPLPSVSTCNNPLSLGSNVNPSGKSNLHFKSSVASKGAVAAKKSPETSTVSVDCADISQFYDAHCKSMEKQAGLMAVGPVPQSLMRLAEKPGSTHYGSRRRENGPVSVNSVEGRTSPKLNGPSPQGSVSTVMVAMNDMHPKKLRLSPKQLGISKGFPEGVKEDPQSKEAIYEKLSRLHQQLADQRDTTGATDLDTLTRSGEEAGSSEKYYDITLTQRLEDQAEQLFLDLEEMQAKMMGNGSAVMAGGANSSEGKGGNITSIYSKRSSPVNVNMLNHIYAPGLPLPRRLTESVQRLVKPLPASEMAVSASSAQSRAYNNKSPAMSTTAGLSSRASSLALSSATNGPHHYTRMTSHSGARSPGASMPRLIPSDQHRLLSGGLDLAGLSNLQVPPSAYLSEALRDHGGGGGLLAGYSSGKRDDPMPVPVNLLSSSNLLKDATPGAGIMLSQSYPPFKSRDPFVNARPSQHNHDVQIDLNNTKNNMAVQRSLKDVRQEVMSSHRFKGNSQFAFQSEHPENNHIRISKQLGLLNQDRSNGTDTNHSSDNPEGSDLRNFSVPSSTCSASSSVATLVHSNASSPLMPTLQRGQEPPITPTLPSNMPSSSSQPPFISLATAPEISEASQVNNVGSKPTTNASPVVTTPNPVPYPPSVASNSNSSPSANTGKGRIDKDNGDALSLPPLSPMANSPIPSLVEGSDVTKSSAAKTLCADTTQIGPESDRLSPPKLTRAPQALSPRASYPLNRNLFESVSSEALSQHTKPSVQAKATPTSQNVSLQSEPSSCDSQKVNLPSDQSKGDSNITVNTEDNSKQDHQPVALLSADKHIPKDKPLPLVTPPTTLSGVSTSKIQTASPSTDTKPNVESPAKKEILSTLKDPEKLLVNRSSVPSKPPSIEDNPPTTLTLQKGLPSASSTAVVKNLSDSSAATSNLVEKVTPAKSDYEQDKQTKPSPTSSATRKEPILETLASSLSSGSNNKNGNSGESSKQEKDVSPASKHTPTVSAENSSKLEQAPVLPNRSSTPVVKDSGASLNPKEAQTSPQNRVTRKRKLSASEEEHPPGKGLTPSSSGNATPSKHIRLSSDSSAVKSETGGQESSGPTNHTSCIPNTARQIEKVAEVAPSNPPPAAVEQKESVTKVSMELERSRERRRHRSTTSSHSDDGHSYRSSSTESRDSSSHSHTRESGRSHRGVTSGTPDREARSHRSSADSGKSSHHKDSQSKENRSASRHHSSEDAKHCQVDWSSSEDGGGNKEKPRQSPGGKGIPAPVGGDSKSDDAHKKGQRVRRQFYAYVPEKSLDQTYFDVPILSGRTRSKNKPADEETTAATTTAAATSTTTPTVSAGGSITTTTTDNQGLNTAVTSSASSVDSSAGGAASQELSGKRSTRSVRTKDTAQEQNLNKRRKLQQQR